MKRKELIYAAVGEWGYSQKEVADYLWFALFYGEPFAERNGEVKIQDLIPKMRNRAVVSHRKIRASSRLALFTGKRSTWVSRGSQSRILPDSY